MCREIGDRGLPPTVDEGLPPTAAAPQQEGQQAFAPQLELGPAPVLLSDPSLHGLHLEASVERRTAASPTMHGISPLVSMEHAGSREAVGSSSGLLELHMALVAKYDATLEQVQELLARQRLREGLTPAMPTADELSALQARLEAMEAAELLTEEEMLGLDDVMADFLAVRAVAPAVAATMGVLGAAAAKVRQMVDLSQGFGADRRFARQLRRQFLSC
jgi:hypothetical protein